MAPTADDRHDVGEGRRPRRAGNRSSGTKRRVDDPGAPLKGVRHRRWHPETLTCAFEGHVAPGAVVRDVGPEDRLVAIATDDGVRFARCLRCDAWVLADPADAAADRLPDVSQIVMPQRGKALKDAFVLKLIAVNRGFHAVVFAMIAVIVLVLELHLAPVQGQIRRFLDDTQTGVAGTGQDASRSFVLRQLQHLAGVRRGTLILLLVTATAYAVLEGVEAVGLWRQRRWAEYLTAIATAGFLPFEVHELAKRVSVGRVVALVINLAVLAYLLWAKRLFGIRGGGRRDESDLETAEVLEPLPGQFPDGGTEAERPGRAGPESPAPPSPAPHRPPP
ncbi:MAG: hypothetical protein QOI99_1014 [Actinomycetota bacterium]|nr:hypothetical protein [Actinomycetota bacterium]